MGLCTKYKSALEKQLGENALEKFDNDAKANMKDMNNYSNILYSKFKSDILKYKRRNMSVFKLINETKAKRKSKKGI